MAAQDLVNKLKETLGGGDSHPDHPQSSEQPQHQHVSEQTEHARNEHLESRGDAPQHQTGGSTTQKVRSLVEPYAESNTNTSSQTQQRPSESSSTRQNPRDAAHVPPSVLAQHVGEPSIEHGFAHDSKTQRHSSLSHQEEHYNIR